MTWSAIVEFLAAVKAKTGLTFQCDYDPNWYPTGVKITESDNAAIPLRPTTGTTSRSTASLCESRELPSGGPLAPPLASRGGESQSDVR